MTFDHTNIEHLKTINSDAYKAYLAALCRLASEYVSRIRVQFAEKAFEMYENETVRKLVLAYGEEATALDANRLSDFRHVSEYGARTSDSLNDSCLNKANHYGQTIKFLFDIK